MSLFSEVVLKFMCFVCNCNFHMYTNETYFSVSYLLNLRYVLASMKPFEYDKVHTTRNAFKRGNFNMQNTEIAFYSFKQFGYLSLHIGGNIDSVEEVYCLFFMYLKNKSFKYLKYESSFLAIYSNVSYVPSHQKKRWR